MTQGSKITSNTGDQLRDDLAFAANLAREGASAPLIGGRYGLFWGSLLFVTFLAHWFIASGLAGVDMQYVGAVWLGYGVVAVIGSIVLAKTEKSDKARTAAQKVEGAVWGYFGLALLALFIGIGIRIIMGKSDPTLFDLVLPFAFAGYGMAHLTTARISGASHLRWAGYIAILGAVGAMVLYGDPSLYLLGALIIVLAVIAPSIVSLRLQGQANAQ